MLTDSRMIRRRSLTLCVLLMPLAAVAWLACEGDGPLAGAGGGPPVYGGAISSFTDVSTGHWAYRPIEALYQEGYVAGCDESPLKYCPEATLTRAEAAVFVVRGQHGAGFTPPDGLVQPFRDVPRDSWASKWIAQLWADGFTEGCGEELGFPLYCPWQQLNWAEGCVFFIRMLHGADYEPPGADGKPFSNLDPGWWGSKWIEAAWDAGLLPEHKLQLSFGQFTFVGPESPMTRAEAAYVMHRAKPPADFDVLLGPTNLPIYDWSARARWCSGESEECNTRHERARQVKSWLARYEGSRWWRGVFPEEVYLVAWLLNKEGGTLCEQNVQLPRMAEGIRARLLDGLAAESLAHFTAFYDPVSPYSGVFDERDWEMLTQLKDGTATIDIPYYYSQARKAYGYPLVPEDAFRFWWDSTETIPAYAGRVSQTWASDRVASTEAWAYLDGQRRKIPFYFSKDFCPFGCATGQPFNCECP